MVSGEVCGQDIWVYNSKAIGRCLSFCNASSCLLTLILCPRFADHRGDISKQNEDGLHGLERPGFPFHHREIGRDTCGNRENESKKESWIFDGFSG